MTFEMIDSFSVQMSVQLQYNTNFITCFLTFREIRFDKSCFGFFKHRKKRKCDVLPIFDGPIGLNLMSLDLNK